MRGRGTEVGPERVKREHINTVVVSRRGERRKSKEDKVRQKMYR